MANKLKNSIWFSTQSLKNFINEISEEELNSKDFHHEARHSSERSGSEELFQAQNAMNQIAPKNLLAVQAMKYSIIRKRTRQKELEVENAALKEELNARETYWQKNLAFVDQEKKEAEALVDQLQNQLKKLAHDQTEVSDQSNTTEPEAITDE